MAEKILKLGIVGMSDGNGHPYSWAAIFNGFDEEYMKLCPFPVIPEYLSKQQYPADFIDNAKITHVWTQDEKVSWNIAKASRIPYVVAELEQMIGHIDALLLARDDAESHFELAKPFLLAGIPVFIDKPLAYSKAEAQRILTLQQYPDQLFTCSAFRYAKELQLSHEQKKTIGEIKFVEGSIPKSWNNYAIHAIEPLVSMLPERGNLLSVKNSGRGDLNIVTIKWENVTGLIKVTGLLPIDIQLRVYGTLGFCELPFHDTFSAFKGSLLHFVDVVRKKQKNIPIAETLEIISIIEAGAI